MARAKFHDWLTKEGLTLIEGWARLGLSDEQIAKNIDINPRTLYSWKKDHPPIDQALKKGKEVVDFEVENALLKRALGFKETVQRAKVLRNGQVVRYEEEAYYPPDVAAIIFWLKNRMADKWRNNPEEDRGEQLKITVLPF